MSALPSPAAGRLEGDRRKPQALGLLADREAALAWLGAIPICQTRTRQPCSQPYSTNH